MSWVKIINKMFINNYWYVFINISVLVLAASPFGCSEKNPDAPVYNKVHAQAWYDPQFINTEHFHGAEVQSQGTDSCMKCHDINGDGQENIPGCFKCHFGANGSKAPIESNWTHGTDDHSQFEDNQTVCNYCHDFERSFGTGPAICHDCHGAGEESHVLGQLWLDRNSQQFHGDLSQEDCSICHDLPVKCDQCHFGPTGSKAPIGSGWQHGNNDAHREHEGDSSTCNQCHDLNRSYGNSPSSCHDCHGAGEESHVLGQLWLDRNSQQFHGDLSQEDCSICHDLPVKCGQCHFGPTGSKAPIGSGWQHGNNEDHRDYEGYRSTCNQCHDLNRSYGNSPSNCHDCHDD